MNAVALAAAGSQGGLPRISDGQMLFLQHMITKMKPVEEGGGRIAIVMNGSPLFTGDAGSGESEIRRFIMENDLLETIVALPSQLFYNTGIHTYIWVLTNRKQNDRRGKVLLINGAATTKENGNEKEVFAKRMRKSLGDKRNELTVEHIESLARISIEFKERPYAKIFNTTDFAYRKVTIERPLRLNFQISEERIKRFTDSAAFQNLAGSKKKDKEMKQNEEFEGKKEQDSILKVLNSLISDRVYPNREIFTERLFYGFEKAGINLKNSLKKAVFTSLDERDEAAEICCDKNGDPEPNTELRDYEYVPYKEDIYEYFVREVRPHVPDAWINEKVRDEKDGKIGKVGYEINFNRYFYQYEPPRPLKEIDEDIRQLESEIMEMLREVTV